MGHRRFGELIAGQALDDLDGRERAALDAHVPACAECRTTARELDETVALLALAAPARRPPPSLRERVLGAIAAPHGERPYAIAVRGAAPEGPSRPSICHREERDTPARR